MAVVAFVDLVAGGAGEEWTAGDPTYDLQSAGRFKYKIMGGLDLRAGQQHNGCENTPDKHICSKSNE